MNVLIITDLEGVSGIFDWDRHELRTPQDQWQRKLMTGEVNAAVDAAFEAGAKAVKVAEGHNAIDNLTLDSRVTLVPAVYPAIPPLQGWDEGFHALIAIGKHAMSGTPDGVLAHTGSRAVEWTEVNGIRVGESGVEAMEAGDYGFPMVMISGDVAACREMKQLLGDIEVAPVKRGYDMHHCDCLHPAEAQDLIRSRVEKALKRLHQFEPFKVEGPIEYVERMKEPYADERLQTYASKPFVTVRDDRTLVFSGQNVVEAFARRCGVDYSWPED